MGESPIKHGLFDRLVYADDASVNEGVREELLDIVNRKSRFARRHGHLAPTFRLFFKFRNSKVKHPHFGLKEHSVASNSRLREADFR